MCTQYAPSLVLKSPYWGLFFVDCCKKMNQSRKRFLLTVNFSYSSIIFSQTVSVIDNRIHKIDDGAFYGLNKLHTLKLVRCRLRLMPPVTDVKGRLRSLDLRRNLITFIPFGYFQGFVKLEALFIDQNRMVRFPDVRQLNQTLYMLYLSYNRIPVIPRNIISSCFHPKYLKMSMNMLQTLRRSFFDGENTVVKVSMFGNPWRCDSALAWLCDLDIGNFIHDGLSEQFPMFGRARFSDYTELRCAQPDLYAGVKIIELSKLMKAQYYVNIPESVVILLFR